MKESKNWSDYCRDPSKIEGYDRAVNDTSNTRYACHHRYETHFEDGSLRPKPLSADLLNELGYYYHRPPYELIILTVEEHTQLHRLAEGKNTYATRDEAREALLEWKKQRYQDHRVEEREQRKQWYEDHKTEVLERSKRYYEEHKDQCKRQMKVSQWIKAHPTSTDFPATWNDEDKQLYLDLIIRLNKNN